MYALVTKMVVMIQEYKYNLVPFSTRIVRGSMLGSQEAGGEASGEGGREGREAWDRYTF